ncbi:unannotated protein [freshwater metagenome]|uniref:Unannotated protein n=1 Tax=freshwater metagenome TaxID=449393 RepID=A0A6J7FYK6_9ZZZZ|nr:hypothetical protein [Actinomycetota bacterium]
MTDVDHERTPLRLTGGRFDDASAGAEVGFPLEVITELARYERLLIQVARGIWKNTHPKRIRAPKRFDQKLRLRLVTVDRGSVMPVLAPNEQLADPQLFDPDGLYQRSHELVADALAAVVDEKPLPADFPLEATASLVQFGSSFRDDERCTLRRRSGGAVTYSQAARRHLVKITAEDNIQIDGELVGRVTQLRPNLQDFHFLIRGGARVTGKYHQQSRFEELRPVVDADDKAAFVRLACTFSKDSLGRVAAIDDVREVETVVGSEDAMAAELRGLLELEAGWHDGAGAAPTEAAVEWARDFAAELNVSTDALGLFPTLEGGVLAEMQIDARRWSLEVEPDGSPFVASAGPDEAPSVSEPGGAADAARALEAFLHD